MPDPGLFNPDTGLFDVWCPRCGSEPVSPGMICDDCAEDVREENEFIGDDRSLQRDAEIADEGWETTVEHLDDVA